MKKLLPLFCLFVSSCFAITPFTAEAVMDYLGPLYHPVTSSNQRAVALFNKGLMLIYAFDYYQAHQVFEEALKEDPNLAMAEWGIAFCFNSSDKKKEALPHIQAASKMSASANEKAYIAALALLIEKDTESYYKAMKELAINYPDDLDAQTLYAKAYMDLLDWNLWANESKGTKIISILNDVLLSYPNHIGANHFFIHAIEDSPHPELGLMSAERLAAFPLAEGHIAHMPSHIYYRVGAYHKAVLANEKSLTIEFDYTHTPFYPFHYINSLTVSYVGEGNFAGAMKAISTSFPKEDPEIISNRQRGTYYILTRFAEWTDMLALPPPAAKELQAYFHFCRALAYSHLGKGAEAAAERTAFMAIKDHPELVAYILTAVLDNDEKAFQKAIEMQDSLPNSFPPDWYAPVREAYGAFLIKQKRLAEAESVFRADLKQHPRSGRSLFGLYHTLQGTDALWAEAAFKKAWENADSPLTLDNF